MLGAGGWKEKRKDYAEGAEARSSRRRDGTGKRFNTEDTEYGTQRARRNWERIQRGEFEVFDRKSPPFAQFANGGAPSRFSCGAALG